MVDTYFYCSNDDGKLKCGSIFQLSVWDLFASDSKAYWYSLFFYPYLLKFARRLFFSQTIVAPSVDLDLPRPSA